HWNLRTAARPRTPLALRLSGVSIPDLNARVHAGRPVAGRAERHDGPHLAGGRERGAGVRDGVGVEGQVDLVAGPQDAAPVQEVVADEDADVLGDVVAELRVEVGEGAEARRREVAGVAGQGKRAAGEILPPPVDRSDALAAVDVQRLMRDAESAFHTGLEVPAAAPPFGIDADLAAV